MYIRDYVHPIGCLVDSGGDQVAPHYTPNVIIIAWPLFKDTHPIFFITKILN